MTAVIQTYTSDAVSMLGSFTDVVYLSARGRMIPDVQELIGQKKLSSVVLPVERADALTERLDSIGTVIIDADGMDAAQHRQLSHTIEVFERENIGVILLGGRVEASPSAVKLPVSANSFSMTSALERTSVDELWVKISVNLSYRRKSAEMMVRPSATSQECRAVKNTLAERLRMTGALVDNLVEQLRMAGLVQRDFLPSQLPNSDDLAWAAVFMPAEWVSGDIYDAVRVDENHVGFYIADAVGHAMPAALLTIFVKQALVMRETRGNDYHIFPPLEVIGNLNRRMTSQKLSGYQFATCCYCLLNTRTLELTFTRAGHPYPVLIRPGCEPVQLEGRGSLLGVFDQAQFSQETVQLQRGDRLLLYSDGAEPFIGHFDDARGFQFNREFLDVLNLPIEQFSGAVTSMVESRQVAAGEVDDVTMLCLQIR